MKLVIEGIDGAGKDTFITNLSKRLKELNYHIEEVRTPIEPFSNIRKSFDDKFSFERFLFYIVSSLYTDKVLENSRGIVILNRHVYSSIAYPLATLEDNYKKLVEEIVKRLSFQKVDFYIFIKADVDVIIKRLMERKRNKSNIYDRQLEDEFIKEEKFLKRLYYLFYEKLPSKLMPILTKKSITLVNNTPEDMKTAVDYLCNIIKNCENI